VVRIEAAPINPSDLRSSRRRRRIQPLRLRPPKQVYVYGALDPGPTEFVRDFGMAWGFGGWLLTPFLKRICSAGRSRLRSRVAAELKTTFASHYRAEVSFAELLRPRTLAAADRRSTGAKLLVNPARA
jgi:NADPH2:quinone reductase